MKLRNFAVHAIAALALFAVSVRSEKGDTLTAEMNAKGLPPNCPNWIPAKTKSTAYLTMSDNGIKNKNTVYIWTADTFSLGKTTWDRIVLVSTLLPGCPEVFTIAPEYQADFPNGNFTLGEIPQAFANAGLDMVNLADNSTYAIAVVDSVNNTAIGGVLIANYIATYGNGSIADDPNAIEEDQLLYVADMNNYTLEFPQGFTSGLTPTNGTGDIIFQELPDGGYLWSLEMAIMRHPAFLQLRWFEDLDSQPVLLNLSDASNPAMPRIIPADAYSYSFEGNITKQQIVDAVSSIGLDWNKVNFNTTPPEYLVTLTDAKGGSILGFVFNADDAPTPPPVIKGSANRACSTFAAVLTIFACLILNL